MSLGNSVIATIVAAVMVFIGGLVLRRSRSKTGPILEKRDKAIEKVQENVRKDVEKMERRREEVLTRSSTAEALNDLIEKGDL